MGSIIASLIAKGVPARFAKPLLAFVALLALAGLIWAAIAIHDRNVVKTHDATVNAKVIAKTTPANARAADQRSIDTIALAQHEKEAHDAIHSVPDAAPAAPTVRLGCQRLRRQGTPDAKLPAVCRS
jgi:hypothetical protein